MSMRKLKMIINALFAVVIIMTAVSVQQVFAAEEDLGQNEYNNFEYVILEDGTAEITGYAGEMTGNLIIPDSVDGHIVSSIGGWAFSGCRFTGELKLPEKLTSIGGGAFSSCGFSGELKLPESLTSIGDSAFSRCNFTGDIIFPDCIESIGDYAFQHAHARDILGKFELKFMPANMGRYVFDGENYNVFTLDIGTELGINQTRQGNVIVNGMRLSSPIVTKWISSNESVAKVDENGLIMAVSVGEATIRAEIYNDMSCEAILKIGTENITDD